MWPLRSADLCSQESLQQFTEGLILYVCGYFNQVAEIISDVREPIFPISEPVDENEKRRKQVRVSKTL